MPKNHEKQMENSTFKKRFDLRPKIGHVHDYFL
jgi:hypothetical protein